MECASGASLVSRQTVPMPFVADQKTGPYQEAVVKFFKHQSSHDEHSCLSRLSLASYSIWISVQTKSQTLHSPFGGALSWCPRMIQTSPIRPPAIQYRRTIRTNMSGFRVHNGFLDWFIGTPRFLRVFKSNDTGEAEMLAVKLDQILGVATLACRWCISVGGVCHESNPNQGVPFLY